MSPQLTASAEFTRQSPHHEASCADGRVGTAGKFLVQGDRKFWIRGTTYGTFRPDAQGLEYPSPGMVEKDFSDMAAHGFNAVRTYTVPPHWLLDLAGRHRLSVLVGIPWEQHVTFLDDTRRSRDIKRRVREAVRSCAQHPAILGYAVGNEIPASIVRWHGAHRIERYVHDLYDIAKAEDPQGLVTYVNFPTTEYLQLPFLDVACFNVYLEAQQTLSAYMARLQNLAGDRPLIMAEVGLDSRRHGADVQAEVLEWQVRTAFAAGCAGTFLFAWTDEWHRGGYDIDDWDFGLTTRERRPKPALMAVSEAFREIPFPKHHPWPRISVVICSYNGARTIRDALNALLGVDYPNFEVIVVDDGSRDATAAIAHEYGVRVISTENRGLSAARNTGMEAATGEIVAYLDDDAYPDRHWLSYLAAAFMTTAHAGIGGPNIPPPTDGPIADCVARAPGGPIHVLLADQVAEHIPGCNMAFRKKQLQAIGGFDPRFRTAGDDVDVCWRLQERGLTIGFHAAAMVWHHRRNSVRAYLKQQRGYGRAEALLEQKWPQKYNACGHVTWSGRLYGQAAPLCRSRIYHGIWGQAPFQSLYQPAPQGWSAVLQMPEWLLFVVALAGVSLTAVLWHTAWMAPLLLAGAVGLTTLHAWRVVSSPAFCRMQLRHRLLTAALHILQPAARLSGRLSAGLTPWRQRRLAPPAWPWRHHAAVWSEQWKACSDWLGTVEADLRSQGAVVQRGGAFDRWDLDIRDGSCGTVRLLMAVEDHGGGRQFVRVRSWPRSSAWTVLCTATGAVLCGAALWDQAWSAAVIFAGVSSWSAWRLTRDCAAAAGVVKRSVARLDRNDTERRSHAGCVR